METNGKITSLWVVVEFALPDYDTLEMAVEGPYASEQAAQDRIDRYYEHHSGRSFGKFPLWPPHNT